MNKWIGSGKVIKDPTIRYKEDKTSFVAFTMMCKRNRKIKDGDQAVDFYRLYLYRQYCRTGAPVFERWKENRSYGAVTVRKLYRPRNRKEDLHKDGIRRRIEFRGNESRRRSTPPGRRTTGTTAGAR